MLHQIISERDEVMSKAYMTLKESKDLHSYLKSMTTIHHDRSNAAISHENNTVHHH